MPMQGPCSCLAFSSSLLPIFSAFAANSLPHKNSQSDHRAPCFQHSKGSPLIPCVPPPRTQCTLLFSHVRPVQLSWRAERLPCSLAGVSVISAADQRHWVMQLGFPGKQHGALMPPQLCTYCCPPPLCILMGLSCGGAGSHELSSILLLPVTGTWTMLEQQPWLLGCVCDRPVRGQAGMGGWHGQSAAMHSWGHGCGARGAWPQKGCRGAGGVHRHSRAHGDRQEDEPGAAGRRISEGQQAEG